MAGRCSGACTNGAAHGRGTRARRRLFRPGGESCSSYFEATIARDAAGLEVEGRDLRESLELFDIAVNPFHRGGNHAQLIITLSTVATFFERIGQHEAAAVIIGALERQPSTPGLIPDLGRVEHLVRTTLGEAAFARCVADHAVFELGPAARYAEREVHKALAELGGPSARATASS